MTPEEHYVLAEQTLADLETAGQIEARQASLWMALAQVHATLATARPAEPPKPTASSKADWDAARLLVKMAATGNGEFDVERLVSRSHPVAATIAHRARVEADKVDSLETAGEGVSPQIEAAIMRLGLDATR